MIYIKDRLNGANNIKIIKLGHYCTKYVIQAESDGQNTVIQKSLNKVSWSNVAVGMTTIDNVNWLRIVNGDDSTYTNIQIRGIE